MSNSVNSKEAREGGVFQTAFPISSVWFGALVGPSMVSGAFAAVYFAPYGAWGLILPFVTMGLACFIIAMGMEGVRHFQVYEYSAFAKCLYGRFSKIMCPLLEIFIVLAMIVGGSAVVAMGGTFFNDLLGLPELAGAILMAAISTVLVLWGAGLVRKASTFMTIILVGGFFLLVLFSSINSGEKLGEIVGGWQVPEGMGFWVGVPGAVSLGLSNASNALTLSSVAQNVRKRSHVVAVGLCSLVLNSACFIACTLLLLPYCPEALYEAVPNLYIINNFLVVKAPWLPLVYSIVMFFGLASSGAPQLHAVASRVISLYPEKGPIKTAVVKNLVTSVVYMTLCILISFLGLRTIISKGYGLLGGLAVPLIVIPLCILMPINIYRKNKGEKSA